ncbi:hypothetical protein FEM48_Zijuj01G0053600 [Ziziphus jujuba var. spinosa]|uniref:S-adenosyl-L-methionine-dependent methyltransferase n=1 Tax=Ziziphus jujuba var. spinosa TaxID=714518 RepID=A0A978VZD0_ZIZJJ|nr:hypothetical protein FEM48_Zijuj01G0053600 [Ziziphus jujuba var. spinosa]
MFSELFSCPSHYFYLGRSMTHASKTNRNGWLRAKLHEDDDPLLRATTNAASLPFFVDPYVGCFVSPHIRMGIRKSLHPYCIETKFIDDKLLRTVNHIDGLKQVVLLSDGMDTRPYRLSWPTSTIIFDVSPERVFKRAAEKLEGVGSKLPRSCLFLHVPLESSNLQQSLRAKALMGLLLLTLRSFEEILLVVSCLAMNGSFFMGELPSWLRNIDIGIKSTTGEWMEKLFKSNGFWVDIVIHKGVAKSLGKDLASIKFKIS